MSHRAHQYRWLMGVCGFLKGFILNRLKLKAGTYTNICTHVHILRYPCMAVITFYEVINPISQSCRKLEINYTCRQYVCVPAGWLTVWLQHYQHIQHQHHENYPLSIELLFSLACKRAFCLTCKAFITRKIDLFTLFLGICCCCYCFFMFACENFHLHDLYQHQGKVRLGQAKQK